MMSPILNSVSFMAAVLWSWFLPPAAEAGIPVPEEFFQQTLDHFSPEKNSKWFQRYYTYGKHFKGPGHPIFLILGGEGGISPEAGIVYPFVGDHLAKTFGAFVVQPEHRFYGKSQPLANHTHLDADPRVTLFTSEQALYDAMGLVEHVRSDLGCSARKNGDYCPIVTFGGSYPGFLSAFARILFPDIVDMAYAASAPMKFYGQQTAVSAYYDHITKVAEETLTGCEESVRESLEDVQQLIVKSKDRIALSALLGICDGSLPDYILDSPMETLAEELMMVVGYTFANDNMANYPPGNHTRLYKSCEIFKDDDLSSTEKVQRLLTDRLASDESCWKMNDQLPNGPNATISGGDWSGDGVGPDGESWDFQTCTLLVEAIGFSKESMFPERHWTLQWLEEHCMARFGVKPRPYELVQKYGFDDLVARNVTKILFTNGLKDGWSVSGIQSNLSDTLIALNFEHGAHHSDLNHVGPSPSDTDDIKHGYEFATRLLGEWLGELQSSLKRERLRGTSSNRTIRFADH